MRVLGRIMNSQALQKRIFDGKLSSHGPITDWPYREFRRSLIRGTGEDMPVSDGKQKSVSEDLKLNGDSDPQRTEYFLTNIPSHGKRNWGMGSWLRGT